MIRKIRANYLDGICERYKINLPIPDSLDTCEKLNQIFQTRRISLVFRRGSSRNLVPRVRVACVAGSQNSITGNGNRLDVLYWYKAIVRCKHLVPRILQREFKFSSWLKVNKIPNQIVHHHSATKFASMLQDIKKLQACKTAKMLTADWLIISIFYTTTWEISAIWLA